MKLLFWLNILSWYFEVVCWVLFIEFCKLPRYLTLWALLSDHLCGDIFTVYTSKPISDLRKTSVYHKYFVVRYYLLEAPILFFTCKSQIVINGAVFFWRIKFTRFSTVYGSQFCPTALSLVHSFGGLSSTLRTLRLSKAASEDWALGAGILPPTSWSR